MKPIRSIRPRHLAFGIGALGMLAELLLLVAMSQANAPDGQRFAGTTRCAPMATVQTSPVMLLRRLERSL